MKILLSWLLDHLDCSQADIDVDRLVHLFNTRTAEIESYDRVTCDLVNFFVVRAVASSAQAELFCPELHETVFLPTRTDLVIGKSYLAFRSDKTWHWVTAAQFCEDKEGLMPAICVPETEQKGLWRNHIPLVDYVLDIDNKSINHRPDLWGHYGIAREVAAFLEVHLKPIEKILAKLEVSHFDNTSSNQKNMPLSISLEAGDKASRFAGLSCRDVQEQDSDLWMAIRLLRVGAKPMNAVVDITNYVMFDIGHPMHVFDGAAFAQNSIVVRMAESGERLQLLDGQDVTLALTDVVIADDDKPVSLAGIMGGKSSGFHAKTQNIVLEAAGFDPAVIRKTAQRLKLRTEASMRFEKHLDPMQNIAAIKRFIFLAEKLNIALSINGPIVSVGKNIEPKEIVLHHSVVEKNLGSTISSDFIERILTELGFQVDYDNKHQVYKVLIPTYRMTKDIAIQQDLIEEIIRSYGFENIESVLPMRATVPFSINGIHKIGAIKRHLAYGLAMHEVRDYLLYDASFVSRITMDLSHAVRMRNSLSENWTTLVTSLVPHLLKSVEHNIVGQEHIRFFEYNRIWHAKHEAFVEQKSLAGIIFDKNAVDFYTAKAELESLWKLLKMQVVWKKPEHQIPVWYDAHQVAQLWVGEKLLGWAGMMSSAWSHPVIDSGSAFIFEIDGEFLEEYKAEKTAFKTWSKFQDVSYDISLFIPLDVTVDSLRSAILGAHSFIQSVHLVDFFEKEEWTDKRAITLRYVMSCPDKTMTKTDLDGIVQLVHNVVAKYHAKIR